MIVLLRLPRSSLILPNSRRRDGIPVACSVAPTFEVVSCFSFLQDSHLAAARSPYSRNVRASPSIFRSFNCALAPTFVTVARLSLKINPASFFGRSIVLTAWLSGCGFWPRP